MCLLSLAIVILAANFSYAQNLSQEREGRIKTATLYYLAKFVTWPQGDSSNLDSKLHICIVGNSELNPFIQEILEGKPVGRRAIATRLLSFEESVGAAANCSLIYFGDLTEEQMQTIVKMVLEKPVVTVSSTRSGADFPTVIYLYKERNNVRIEVNLQLAKKLQLQISSELLQVSKVVQ